MNTEAIPTNQTHHRPIAGAPRVLIVAPDGASPRPGTDDTLAITTVATPQACRRALADRRHRPFAAIVVDWQLGDGGGAALLDELRRRDESAALIALLPPGQPDAAGAARRAGAVGCLPKTPDYPLHLPYVVAAALDAARLRRERDEVREECRRAERAAARDRGQRDELVRQTQALLDQLSDGVLLFEAAGERVILANATAERLCGLPFRPARSLADYPGLAVEWADGRAIPADEGAALLAARRGVTVVQEDVVIHRPDDGRVPATIAATPLRAGDGAITGVVGVIRDRSESAHLASLREAVVTIASHQMKNPLTVILGYSALLLKSAALDADERARGAAAKIRRESLRLRRLVDDLLEFSRLELGRIAFQTVPLDLAALVDAVVARQRDRLGPRAIRLRRAAEVGLVGDYGRLAQVLDTLLGVRAAAIGSDAPLGVALGRHTADELAAVGASAALPARPSYATIAIGDAATADAAAPPRADWQPFPAIAAPDAPPADQDLGVLVSAALVRAHGGMLYANERQEFLVALPVG